MSAQRYRHIRSCVSFLVYHFVWCPKHGRSVLTDAIARRVEELVRMKAKELHCMVTALTVMPDYVHVVVACPPTHAPQHVVNQFKGITSRVIRNEFPHLRSRMPSLWSRSYFVASAGAVVDSAIQTYIDQQKRSTSKSDGMRE